MDNVCERRVWADTRGRRQQQPEQRRNVKENVSTYTNKVAGRNRT